MTLKAVLDSLDGVNDALKGEYEQRDGKFVLALDGDIPGFAPKAKLDEFRTNNTALLQERDALKAQIEQFKDIDPVKAREAIAKLAELGRKKMLDAGEYELAIEDARKAMLADKEQAIAAMQQQLDAEKSSTQKLNEQIFMLTVEQGIRDAWAKPELGLVPTAVRDALDAARLTFRMKDGKPVPYAQNGNIMYGGKGEPMTFQEWIEAEIPQRPHWQNKSTGAGGAGNPAGGGQKGDDLMRLSPLERMRLGRRTA